MVDFVQFVEYWLGTEAGLDLDDNDIINFYEFSKLTDNWSGGI